MTVEEFRTLLTYTVTKINNKAKNEPVICNEVYDTINTLMSNIFLVNNNLQIYSTDNFPHILENNIRYVTVCLQSVVRKKNGKIDKKRIGASIPILKYYIKFREQGKYGASGEIPAFVNPWIKYVAIPKSNQYDNYSHIEEFVEEFLNGIQ